MERSGSPPENRKLSELGEFGLIARLTGGLELGPGVEVGVGDDAAVLEPSHGHKLVVTTDVLVEGLDFTAALSEPEDWGWKAVAANLSDLAAMGAEARWLVLALTVPGPTPVATLERVYAGVGEACRAFGVALVGGDVSAGPVLSLAVTALGEAERPVLRSGARPGDRLCVTGPLGAAAAGLGLLQRDDRAAGDLLGRFPGLAAAHRRPIPALAMGLALARAGASALIDVSDGLAGDALHLAEASGVGLEVHDATVPLAPGVAEAAALLGLDPLELALGGGEDFVLAAALPRAADLGGVLDCGRFIPDPGTRVRQTATGQRPLTGLAYDHFSAGG
ncbi:MAG: thiamine-phosphate kinase [Actinomycetes bacterium]